MQNYFEIHIQSDGPEKTQWTDAQMHIHQSDNVATLSHSLQGGPTNKTVVQGHVEPA